MSVYKRMQKALIIWGGWEGHQPREVAEIFREDLAKAGFQVQVENRLEILSESDLKQFALICPIRTMDEIRPEDVKAVDDAVQSGVGLGGCHGGMCDAFRNSTEWQFITGGQWVAHPGNDGVRYTVNITDKDHPICQSISDFEVVSEQYYMHVDPANHVLATTRFPIVDGPHTPNGKVDMPVVWTRMWGKGRVFYSSLGHQANVIDHGPAREINRRGLLWAAKELN